MKPTQAEITRQLQATKHRKRGRTWDYLPNEWAQDRNPYEINRVLLKVAKPGTAGRWEAHTNSRSLLLRFHAMSSGKVCFRDIRINGESLPELQVKALYLYLLSSKGLTYFRRTAPTGYTASVLVDLLSRIGIQTKHVIRPQSSDQVSTGPENPAGAGADRQRAQSGR